VDETTQSQWQTGLPSRPIVRRFDIHCGHCAASGARVQGRHALQTSDALGAAASQLGPHVHAAKVILNKELGRHGRSGLNVFEFAEVSPQPQRPVASKPSATVARQDCQADAAPVRHQAEPFDVLSLDPQDLAEISARLCGDRSRVGPALPDNPRTIQGRFGT
jgi:hypothetical protein